MNKVIRFGIDLGTTNSCIAQSREGIAEVFRNPMSMKETLPSVVAYRKNRILVGDKAREYMQRDPHNVVGAFKRKMGTSERFYIQSLDQEVSPVDLSAEVLKELKNFVHTGEKVQAAVITIPASFDTIQSNATRQAGHLAGFKHVTLLQEPIAASLAYVNKHEDDDTLIDGTWMVYDLGGGTFDVALVEVDEGEMRVVDHEGDNFLGGGDFDALIVDKLVIPYLYKAGKFSDLENAMKSASGAYNKLYFQLLHKAEEAKIQLSSHPSADIEFEVEDETGELLDIYMTIERSDFEALIAEDIEETVQMIQRILVRNELGAENIAFILMVGGSTYIPYVREKIEQDLAVAINCNIDPTTAVGLGAGHYAGTRTWRESKISLEKKNAPSSKKDKSAGDPQSSDLQVKVAYQKATQESEEFFVAQLNGDLAGVFYRITRQDGGFDSGLQAATPRIEEDLPLVENAFNYFTLSFYDAQRNLLDIELPPIGIAQGKFSVSGQPLPHDICIEVDDVANKTTKLEAVFRKNEILPLRRTLVKEVVKTIRMGADERIVINILEGPEDALPAVNLPIGFIEITGKHLSRDLIQGSDVEVTVEISESRDLRITAYLLLTDQEFTDVFTANERKVDIQRLVDEIGLLIQKAKSEAQKLEDADQIAVALQVEEIREELERLLASAKNVSRDDVTDVKFQLDDNKRKLAQLLSTLTREQAVTDIKMEFFRAKRYCRRYVDKYGSDAEKASMAKILETEKQVLKSNNIARIVDATDRLWKLSYLVRWETMEYLGWLFPNYYANRREDYIDKEKADEWIEKGNQAMEANDVKVLQRTVNALYELLPSKKREPFEQGTGIG